MRVKVGETWYDPNDVFIMVEFTDDDRKNIAEMHMDSNRYAACPLSIDLDEMKRLMEIPAEETIEEYGIQS